MRSLRRAIGIGAALLGIGAASTVRAQGQADDYPSRVVTVVIPLAGGGGSEADLRLYLHSIGESTGKRFIVDYKGGAGTTIGTGFVAKAAPDGYTLLCVNSPFTITPSVYPDLVYDNLRDFAPVTLMTKHVLMLVVHPSAPYRTLPEYIAYARANPEKLNYGTGGIGGAIHLPGVLLHHMTGTKVTFVHYKAPTQRMPDLMSGILHSTVASFSLALSTIKAGKLRAVGVTTNQRAPVWPELLTFAEQGVPGYDFSSWVGLVAPARTPPTVINKLNTLFVAAGKHPNVVKKLEFDGTIIVGGTPEQFRQHIATETNGWRKLIAETGIKPQAD